MLTSEEIEAILNDFQCTENTLPRDVVLAAMFNTAMICKARLEKPGIAIQELLCNMPNDDSFSALRADMIKSLEAIANGYKLNWVHNTCCCPFCTDRSNSAGIYRHSSSPAARIVWLFKCHRTDCPNPGPHDMDDLSCFKPRLSAMHRPLLVEIMPGEDCVTFVCRPWARQPNENAYWIPLNKLDTHEKLIHWIHHLSLKNWFTKEVMMDFVDVVCGHHNLSRFD